MPPRKRQKSPPLTPPTSDRDAGGDRTGADIAAIDFFSALARSLDALQRQLANANNTFADFVVKEFRLDTPVALKVDSLGAVSFVLPTEETKPETLTRLAMVLSPVAKAPDAPSVFSAEDQRLSDQTPIAETPYIPLEKINRLRGSSIATVGDFLGVAADVRFSAALESMLATTRKEIGAWADRIRLASAGRLTMRQMEILEKEGIVSLATMASISAETRARLTRLHPAEFPAEKLDALIALVRPRLPLRPIDFGSLIQPGLSTLPVQPPVRPVPPPLAPVLQPVEPVLPPVGPVRPVRPVLPPVGPVRPVLTPVGPVRPVRPMRKGRDRG